MSHALFLDPRKAEIEALIKRANDYFYDRAKERGKFPTSFVVAVRDHGGGMRVVVTDYLDIPNHKGPGEELYVVPCLNVDDPVAWEDLPKVVYVAEKYLSYKLAPDNRCGSCTFCCRVPSLYSATVKKPSGVQCQHCDGSGCKIYFARPRECREFSCMWLESQSKNDVMPPELRPDRCGVMFTRDTLDMRDEVFEVHVDRERTDDPLSKPEVVSFIESQRAMGRLDKFVTHYVNDR